MALLLLVLLLVLSPPRACGAGTELELGQWVWGEAGRALPLSLSRGKRDHGGQAPGATTATPGHSHAATALISSDLTDGGSVSPPAPGTNASLLRVPTTADPMDDETDSPDPDLLLSSAPPAAGTNPSLPQGLGVPTTADATDDETDSPDPDLLLSSAPPAAVPGTNASLPQALTVPTTADLVDETDSPDPDVLLGSEPQKGISTPPVWLTPPGEKGTVPGGPDSTSSAGPPSAAPPTLGPTTTGYRKVGKAGGAAAPTRSAPGDTTPAGTAVPWDPSGVMGKCLLTILLLGLVAATFLVCTGVLGALLWRRARTGQRRLGPTEMVCISSLLADAEAAAGPRPVPARRHKRLHDGSAEPDGDNLTLSSFLPEHS